MMSFSLSYPKVFSTLLILFCVSIAVLQLQQQQQQQHYLVPQPQHRALNRGKRKRINGIRDYLLNKRENNNNNNNDKDFITLPGGPNFERPGLPGLIRPPNFDKPILGIGVGGLTEKLKDKVETIKDTVGNVIGFNNENNNTSSIIEGTSEIIDNTIDVVEETLDGLTQRENEFQECKRDDLCAIDEKCYRRLFGGLRKRNEDDENDEDDRSFICLPKFASTCFAQSMKSIMGDNYLRLSGTPRKFVRELHRFIFKGKRDPNDPVVALDNKRNGPLSIIREPEDTARSLSYMARNFQNELIDFFERFNTCQQEKKQQILRRNLYSPNQYTDEHHGERDLLLGSMTMNRNEEKSLKPRINLGLTADLGSIIGGAIYLGFYMDPDEMNLRNFDPDRLNFHELDYSKAEFGGFVNICLGAVAGASGKYNFAGGVGLLVDVNELDEGESESEGEIRVNNETDQVEHDDDEEEEEENPFEDYITDDALLWYANKFDEILQHGITNHCIGSDAGGGIGIGGFLCGMKLDVAEKLTDNDSVQQEFIDYLMRRNNHQKFYFEAGSSAGPSVGGDAAASRCKMYSFKADDEQYTS